VTGPPTGRNHPRREESPQAIPLDRLLKPDFPVRARGSSRDRHEATVEQLEGAVGWGRVSEVIRLDPETYVPQEVIPDEVLTRRYADRGRPHPIPNRPPPEPDMDEEGFFNDPGTWEFREELRECENCGEPFLANAHNHCYCSPECAREGRSFARVCLACGEEFETERPEQIYCSIQCSGRAKRNPANDRLCRECGGPFHATRPQQVFCSRACAWVWRKRERAR